MPLLTSCPSATTVLSPSAAPAPAPARRSGGRAVATQPLHKRLALLGAEVLEPRKGADTSGERLRVRQKDCFRLKYVPYILKQLMPKLTHKHDGLVFLQSEAPYGAPAFFEWSPASPSAEPASDTSVTEAELLAWAEQHFVSK